MTLYLYKDTHKVTRGGIWLDRVLHNTVYDQFQKQPLQVADKRVELDGIRLNDGDIALRI